MRARSAVTVVLLATAGCTARPGRVAQPEPSTASLPRTVAVQVVERGSRIVRRLPLEQYVQGAVIAEFAPASGEPSLVTRMYEVQAVLARTYAVTNGRRHAPEGYDLCATTHCQLYDPSRLRTSRWTQEAIDAVRRTEGIVLWYGGAPARALFHADCGGHTSAAGSVWGGLDHSYLRAVRDDGPAGAAHASWAYDVSGAALIRALNTDARTRVGDRLDTIEVLDRDAAGRAEVVALHGRREALVRGEELREVLARVLGPRAIRSTRFTVRRRGAVFTFEGRGFGHGVGLCQAGALARLRAGSAPAAVLHHYFPGTSLLPSQ